jgi:hypothetical protein
VGGSSVTDFAHQRQGIALGIVEERHPQLVIGQSGDEMGSVLEAYAPALQLCVNAVDVDDAEVDDRGGVIELA